MKIWNKLRLGSSIWRERDRERERDLSVKRDGRLSFGFWLIARRKCIVQRLARVCAL
jgi:hypothetical protein